MAKRAKEKRKALPKTIYVKVEDGGSGPDYFVASGEAECLVEMSETVKIGVYELVGTKTMRGVVEEQ